MSAVAEAAPGRRPYGAPLPDASLLHAPPEAVRWVICFVVAAALHGIVAYGLLEWFSETVADSGVDTPVVMLDLPESLAPSIAPLQDLPPGPMEQQEAENTPPPKEEETERPELLAEAPLPIPEPPRPEPEQAEVVLLKPEPPKPEREPPPPAPQPTAPQAARTPPPTVVRWQSRLTAHIERFKRYPARAHGEAGIVMVAFTIDHEGRLLRSSIMRSSGSAALDQESLAMLARAQPMPPPPDQIGDDQLTFSLPVGFGIR